MPSHNQFYRLTEARELRGYSVNELAEKINVSRQTIYRYESGTLSPTPEVADRIVDVLGFQYGFFTNPHNGVDISDRPVFFRDMKTNLEAERKKAKRWLQIICEFTNGYEQYLDLTHANIPDFELPEWTSITNEDVDIAAEKTRRFWGLGDGPISDITALMENNGIIICRKGLDAEKLDACSLVKDGRPYVLVNTAKQTCSRDIMNIAHELGHVILHQGISIADIKKDESFKAIEDQAWRFASSFLMPPSVFSSEVGYPTLAQFISMKKRWRVSIGAMIMHCCKLGIIDDAKKQYFFREMSRQSIRKVEPFDDEMPVEESRIFRDCEEIISSAGIKTRMQMFEESGLSIKDYCELISIPKNYLEPTSTRPKLRLL